MGVVKDCGQIANEIGDVRAATDEVARSKASAEKSHRSLIQTLNELTKRIEETNLNLGDFEASKRRMTSGNADLLRQVQELSANASLMVKTKSALASALDESKLVADNEAKERVALLGKFRNMEHMADGLRENYDEEVSSKENLARQLNKALGDADMWRQKYEVDGMAKAEELEMAKLKLQARLSEGQATIEQLGLKLQQLEKAKAKAAADAADMAQQLDQAQILNAAMEKKAKQFDRIVGEWKHKVDGLGMDLDVARKETRNISSELFRVKNAYDESILQLEEVRRENKVLSNEIKDIMDQISEGGRSIHEIDKIRKRLEAEKLELEAALSEAEGALEQEENKVLRAQIELTQIRKEVDHRINEKEEQFLGIKKNMTKGIEGMQAALEAEAKGKAEALRMKKKLESDVGELEIALDHSNANNADTQKAIKTYQAQIRAAATKLDDEQRAKELARDTLVAAEKKVAGLANALEESRTLLEQADRNRRTLEQELADVNESLSDATVQNQAIAAAKRKIESEMQTLNADLDGMSAEAKVCSEKASKAMDDADMNALKGGKKAINKLNTRIMELNSELEAEGRRFAEGQRNLKKSERHIAELTFAKDEDRKNHERMQALIDGLQGKIKSYKTQIEEAEEAAASNLAKFRKVMVSLG